ncbi:hypothetical protein L596_001738 [Steinernema carpocapsae]|uniref:Uncharacterized protein n=1 Tax=Steinernema carpocapsae TaxID=34508 RepID=A0A4U8UME3_STECR|nr:hypothetical protein L596_001738 [Steinernema carpocapsae]
MQKSSLKAKESGLEHQTRLFVVLFLIVPRVFDAPQHPDCRRRALLTALISSFLDMKRATERMRLHDDGIIESFWFSNAHYVFDDLPRHAF